MASIGDQDVDCHPKGARLIESYSHGSIASSTEFISSLSLSSKPMVAPPDFSSGWSIKNGRKVRTLQRAIVVEPGENVEKLTDKTVREITRVLDAEAIERFKRGLLTNEETEIEITHVMPVPCGEQSKKDSRGHRELGNARKQKRTRKQSFANIKREGPITVFYSADGQNDRNPHRSSLLDEENGLTNLDWVQNFSPSKLKSPVNVAKQLSSHSLLSSNHSVDRTRCCNSNTRPPYSYMHLILMALYSHPQHRLSLKEIYQWIEDSFTYYRTTSKGWKNSVRHSLSLCSFFVRQKSEAKTGSYWTLRDDVASLDVELPEKPEQSDKSIVRNLKIASNKASSQNALFGSSLSCDSHNAFRSNLRKRSFPLGCSSSVPACKLVRAYEQQITGQQSSPSSDESYLDSSANMLEDDVELDCLANSFYDESFQRSLTEGLPVTTEDLQELFNSMNSTISDSISSTISDDLETSSPEIPVRLTSTPNNGVTESGWISSIDVLSDDALFDSGVFTPSTESSEAPLRLKDDQMTDMQAEQLDSDMANLTFSQSSSCY